MKLNEYQQESLLTLQPGADLLYVYAKLMIEASESTQIIFKHVYHNAPLDKDKVIEEMGDTLYYLSVAASLLGYSLEDVALSNVAKIRKRHGMSYNAAFYKGLTSDNS